MTHEVYESTKPTTNARIGISDYFGKFLVTDSVWNGQQQVIISAKKYQSLQSAQRRVRWIMEHSTYEYERKS